MNSGHIDQALEAAEEALQKLSEIVDAGFVTAFVHATISAIYGLIGMCGPAFDQAVLATKIADQTRSWPFLISLALAHVKAGRLAEAGEALQQLYRQPRFESKRHIEYFGILTSMPDVIRAELLLAQKDYQQVLDYDLKSHGIGEGESPDAVLPDLLRIRGQALFALDRTDEARETLVEARDIAEAHGSRMALWRILFELSEVAELENRIDDKLQLLTQCRELIDYIAAHCGRPEVRDAFSNDPAVHRALGNL